MRKWDTCNLYVLACEVRDAAAAKYTQSGMNTEVLIGVVIGVIFFAILIITCIIVLRRKYARAPNGHSLRSTHGISRME